MTLFAKVSFLWASGDGGSESSVELCSGEVSVVGTGGCAAWSLGKGGEEPLEKSVYNNGDH